MHNCLSDSRCFDGSQASTNVDTAIIELRSKADLDNATYADTAILQNDGTVSCIFPVAASGNFYYIVIRYRNSIETWSGDSVLMGINVSYDFTTAANKAYNSNMINFGDGNFAVYSGDITQDGNINNSDRYSLQNVLSTFPLGDYYTNDITGDGIVDEVDYRIIENINPLSISVQRP